MENKTEFQRNQSELTKISALNRYIFSFLKKKDLQSLRESNKNLKSQVDQLPVLFINNNRVARTSTLGKYIQTFQSNSPSAYSYKSGQIQSRLEAISLSEIFFYALFGGCVGFIGGTGGGIAYLLTAGKTTIIAVTNLANCAGIILSSTLSGASTGLGVKLIKDRPCLQTRGALEEQQALLDHTYKDAPSMQLMFK